MRVIFEKTPLKKFNVVSMAQCLLLETSPVNAIVFEGITESKEFPCDSGYTTFTSLFFIYVGAFLSLPLLFTPKKSPDLIFTSRSIRGKFANPTVYARGKRMALIKIVTFNTSVYLCILVRTFKYKPNKYWKSVSKLKISQVIIHAAKNLFQCVNSCIVLNLQHSGIFWIKRWYWKTRARVLRILIVPSYLIHV